MKKIDYRKEARGRECQIRLAGVCNGNSETVVLAHYRMNSGIGIKPNDTQGAWSCSSCHDAVDGRIKTTYSRDELRLAHAEGVFRTQEILRREGKL